jgi:hypothetical protein
VALPLRPTWQIGDFAGATTRSASRVHHSSRASFFLRASAGTVSSVVPDDIGARTEGLEINGWLALHGVLVGFCSPFFELFQRVSWYGLKMAEKLQPKAKQARNEGFRPVNWLRG